MLDLKEKANSNDLMVVGHRGSSGTAPENTIASFREAIAAGVDMIEADIQLTKDGYPVVFHDKSISRTSDGSGKVRETNLSEIKEVDAGSWFSDKFNGEHIPMLRDVLELINGKCYLNIEVKNIGTDNTEENVKCIIDTISDYNYLSYTLFSSFYYDTLIQIKNYNPAIHTAAIRIPRDTRLPSVLAESTSCEGFVCALDEMNEEVGEDIKKYGLLAGVYSIDTIEELKKVLRYPVKAVVTNYPELIINEMKKMGLR